MDFAGLIDRSMILRIVVALLFAPIVVIIFISRGLPLCLFLLAVTLVGQWEMYRMFTDPVRGFQRVLGYLIGSAVVVDAYLYQAAHFIDIFMLAVLLSFVIEILVGHSDKFMSVLKSVFVVIYPATFVAFLIRVAEHPPLLNGLDTKYLALLVLISIWIFDTASYFAGRFFGRHPFFPSLSPKKTVEGFLGGIGGVAVMAVVCYQFCPAMNAHIFPIILISAIAGQAGDLSESLLKREMRIKDSSNILPGHGGILDRFDSLFFAGPAVWFYLSLVARLGG